MATPSTTTPTKKKKSRSRKVPQGIVFIKATYNNTIVSVTDLEGGVLVQSSAGRAGFAGARKGTPYAAQQAVTDAMERLKPFGFAEAHVRVRGIGSSRDSAIRSLGAAGITILSIRDMTPIPHNGVRPKKRRRV